eukprot:66110-Pleurochrysis_carterae.AAC.1
MSITNTVNTVLLPLLYATPQQVKLAYRMKYDEACSTIPNIAVGEDVAGEFPSIALPWPDIDEALRFLARDASHYTALLESLFVRGDRGPRAGHRS